tara:strand:- start:4423 stop:5304 length:882 start_codon:yes stop_codon:yes gene_type:complete
MTSSLIDSAKKKVQQGEYITRFSDGSFPNYLVDVGGERYVLKHYGGNIVVGGQLQRRILHLLERNVGGLNYRKPLFLRSPDDAISLEKKVLDNWKNSGIDAPIVEDLDHENLLLSYIKGENAACKLKTGQLTDENLKSLIETISHIRTLALERRDPYLLHNDMHLANFMYDSNGNAIPIDPGLPFKEDLTLEQLDTHINLFMCYSLISPCFGYDQETSFKRKEILNHFVSTLDKPTLQEMRRINKSLPFVERAYLNATQIFQGNREYLNFVNSFSPRQCAKVDQYIKAALRRI